MKKVHLHLITVSMLILLACPLLFGFKSQASSGWYAKDKYRVINNTTVYAYLEYNTLYIAGEGEIPDYTPQTLQLRPWNDWKFSKVVIGSGITRIGNHAFSEFSKLDRIEIPSTTFVANASCFSSIAKETIMSINGTQRAYKNINGVFYDSYQSITAGAPNGANCVFLTDDEKTASDIRDTRYPYFQYVYPRTADENLWLNKIPTCDPDAFSPVAQLEKRTSVYINLGSYRKPLDENYFTAFSILRGTDTYLCAYNMTMYDAGKVVYYNAAPTRYVLTLPEMYQVPGRTYTLIEFAADGTLTYLKDLDNKLETFTYETIRPTSTCVLIYH